jgi:hypothetical protein
MPNEIEHTDEELRAYRKAMGLPEDEAPAEKKAKAPAEDKQRRPEGNK